MKKRLLLLPLCALVMFTGCSKKNKGNEEESKQTEPTSLVTFTENTISLPEEKTHQLTADIDSSLNNYLRFWSSENENIATVSDTGLVTAVSKGSTIIVLQCGKYFARCAVEVTAYVPDNAFSISLSKDTYTLNVNDDYTISPTLKMGSTSITSGYEVSSESSDINVATFDNSTLTMHAVGAGQCDILLTFTYQSESVEQLIYVNVY